MALDTLLQKQYSEYTSVKVTKKDVLWAFRVVSGHEAFTHVMSHCPAVSDAYNLGKVHALEGRYANPYKIAELILAYQIAFEHQQELSARKAERFY